MKKILLFFLIIPFFTIAQSNYNMTLLGSYEWSSTEGSDIWGWADPITEEEYALVCLNDGFSCVNISNPSNPIEEFYIADINSTWRDVKTWGNYAYVTTEANAGLLIVDLSDMTGNNYWHVSQFTNPITGASVSFTAAHNLFIDENGICYIFGASSDSGGSPADGAIFLDVAANAINPVYLGEWDDQYIHDGMVRGDTMFAGCIYTGDLYIVDVSNKSNPLTLGTHQTPNAFTHNAWVSDNGNYVFTTDEKSDAYLAAYDITDINNIQEVDRIQSNPGYNSIPHNTHVDGNFLITSYYRDGTTVHDITHPNNMIEVAYYDSYLGAGDGFDGCWGTYPFLPSGLIISSEINSSTNQSAKLMIYERGFLQACYLEGNITDVLTGNFLTGVSVEILNTSLSNYSTSNLLGDYVSGTDNAATYDIVFSKAGYLTDTLSAILSNGVITVLDVALEPLVAFITTGMVIDVAGNGIANANVVIYNNEFTFNMITDVNGNFSINNMYEASYVVVSGQWGFITYCDNEYVDGSSPITITLEEGYYDDFIFDFGWTSNGNASTGMWERGEPVGTIFAVWQGTSYGALEFNPELDVSLDCGDFAFVTGNGGGSAGDDDVDDGNVILTSPIFDATINSVNYIEYYKWFALGGGNGNSNDELTISISNGISTVLLETITLNSSSLNSWTYSSFDINQYIAATTTMQLIIETADLGSGDLIEAAFDKFSVTNTTPSIINEQQLSNNKEKLINIVDVLGRTAKAKVETPLFYIYDGGTVEKKIVID
jgi:choice-of-anchor B domain-containing protein